MKMKLKVIVAALSAAGIIAPLQQATADTITPAAVVPPAAQTPATPATYTVTYPVTVTLAGGAPQTLNFVFNGASGNWTAPAGWVYDASLNPNANTAVFTTTSGSTQYGVALSSTGPNQFTPGQGAQTTNPPSVGVALLNRTVTGTTLSGWSAATATGTVTGVGITTAPLNGAPAVTQIIGVGGGGVPVGAAAVGSPISVSPTSATSGPGSAAGAVTVNSNQPSQSIGWGQYTVTVPTTPTPAGTTTVNGTIAGSSGSVGASGIYVNNIGGTATYNAITGVINATPTQTAVFSVDTSGNTTVGGTLGVTGNTTLAGTLTSNGISNTGNIGTGTLGVTGNATIGGTLGVAGATTIGSAAGTGGNTVVVNSSGVTATAGTSGLVLNSSGATLSGGGSSMALSGGRATFSGAGGSPVVLTGVASGSGQFDAVNFGQVDEIEKRLKRGISSGAAAANIPQVDTNKAFQLGIGVGGFDGETAFAVGGSARVAANGVLKASVGFAGGGGSSAVWGIGGGWSW